MSAPAPTRPRIQLLVFGGCPLDDAARDSLSKALTALRFSDFEEIDILDPASPEELRAWGSPTILVDGRDVGGAAKGNGACCRLYSGSDRVPSPSIIVASISKLSE